MKRIKIKKIRFCSRQRSSLKVRTDIANCRRRSHEVYMLWTFEVRSLLFLQYSSSLICCSYVQKPCQPSVKIVIHSKLQLCVVRIQHRYTFCVIQRFCITFIISVAQVSISTSLTVRAININLATGLHNILQIVHEFLKKAQEQNYKTNFVTAGGSKPGI